MSFLARVKKWIIGDGVPWRLEPGLTHVEMMVIGLQELAESHNVVGCSDEEIAEVETKCGFKLPTVYRSFLSKVGRDAGPFLLGSDYYYPRLLELNDWAVELLNEDATEFQ